jgi:hypothetical protein
VHTEQVESEEPMSATAWAGLGFTDQLRYSLRTQPRAGLVQVVVGRGPAERVALVASLRELLRSSPPGSLRLTSADGQEEEVQAPTDADLVVQAILDQGGRLSWTFASGSDEAVAQLARLAFGSAKRLTHGANVWARDRGGRLALGLPALPALPASSHGEGIAEQVTPAPRPDYVLEIVAPPMPRRLPVTGGVPLSVLPVSWTDLTEADRQCADRLAGEERTGGPLAPADREWLATYANLLREKEAERARQKAEEANQERFGCERAKRSNHQVRVDRRDELEKLESAGEASQREQDAIIQLAKVIARDERFQASIDKAFSHAVEARCHLVTSIRARMIPDAFINGSAPIITSKGAYIVFPKGFDPRLRSAKAAWLANGFEKRTSKVQNPSVDFQISCSHAADLDREWITYVVRRVSRSVGRDPDRDVLAATHEPDKHAPSKEDGEAIHVHAHVTFRVCDDDGRTWRCGNMHLAIQRELEAINRERGWGLTTSSVAKGRQSGWYTPKGSRRIGWSIDGVFTSCDSDEATRDVARERVPADQQRRPGAGIVVVNAQNSARRLALRRADEKALAEAGAKVVDVMERLKAKGYILPMDARGLITLDYYSGDAFARASSPIEMLLAELSQAVLRRDRSAIDLICKRLDYYEE